MNRGRQAEPGGITRRFSDISHSSPGEPPNRALAIRAACDQEKERSWSLQEEWDQFLLEGRELAHESAPDEEATLLHQSRRLHAAWSKFRRNLPEDQQMQLGDHERPDIQFLVATVTKASATWQSGREASTVGKVKSKFQRLCDICENHSSLLAIIPKDEKYVSLLTGSLSAIVQATINHQNIAEGMADTLDDLGHDIDFWNRLMDEHKEIPALRQYIRELYLVVFEFFTEIFNKWSKSSWKRLLTSFDEGAFKQLFTSKKDRLSVIERHMERHISLDFRHRTVWGLENIEKLMGKLLGNFPRQLDEQRLLLDEFLQKLQEKQSFLLQTHQPVSVTSMITGIEGDDSEPPYPELEADPAPRTHFWFIRAEIQAELAIFTSQWMNQVDHLIQAARQSSVLQLEDEVHYRLGTWLQGHKSDNLWIKGPHGVPRPSPSSLTAVSLAALARTNSIPCIIYFCTFADHHHSELPQGVSLGLFLTSVVTQLVQLLPAQGYAGMDLSSTRFAALARGDLGVVEKLQLIRDVRSIGPRLVYGFIDNFQVLEDRSHEAYTRDFLKTIATLCTLNRESHLPENLVTTNDKAVAGTKVCFTSEGNVDGLAQAAGLQLIDTVDFDLVTSVSMEDVGEEIVWERD